VDGGSGVKSGSGGEEEDDRNKEQCEEEESGYSVMPLLENHLPSLSNIPTPSDNIHAQTFPHQITFLFPSSNNFKTLFGNIH